MIKALFVSILIIASLVMVAPVAAQFAECSGDLAQTEFCKNQPGSQSAADNDIVSVLQTVVNVLSIIVGVVAVFGVIIGGYQMATGGGNPDSVSRGRKTIIYALVGLAVTILARTIIVFVLGRL